MEMAEDPTQVAKLRSALESVDHKRRKVRSFLLVNRLDYLVRCFGFSPEDMIFHFSSTGHHC